MTDKTMEAKCKEYLRIKETIKALEEDANKLLKTIKEEANGQTTTWGKYYASFTEQTTTKLKFTASKIAENFPEIFETLGGYTVTTTAFKGVYKAK